LIAFLSISYASYTPEYVVAVSIFAGNTPDFSRHLLEHLSDRYSASNLEAGTLFEYGLTYEELICKGVI